MQSSEAKQLRKDWGKKECNHPFFAKEYYLGTQTGDHICTVCGAEFSKQEIDIIESNRLNDINKFQDPRAGASL